MEKQYTSGKTKRIMEIGKEIQSIADNVKGNQMVKRMYALHEELTIIMVSVLTITSDEYQRDNETHDKFLDLLYLFLESKDQLEEFEDYVESMVNMEPTVLH